MDCGKEDWGARAGDAVRDAEPGEEENPRAARTSFPLPVEKLGALPGALGHGRAIGLGKAVGSAVNGQGEGTWTGHKRDTQRGPPRAQKGETVPEEPLPAFPAVNSL